MLFAMLAYSFFLKPSYLCFEDATSINTKMSLEIIGSVKITSASTKPLLHEEEAEDAPHQNVLSQIQSLIDNHSSSYLIQCFQLSLRFYVKSILRILKF